MAVAHDGFPAAELGAIGRVGGVNFEAGVVVGAAEGAEEEGFGGGIVELGIVVAGEHHEVGAAVEEGAEGGEELVSPGLGADLGEGALDELGSAGHVEGGGAGIGLEEIEAVSGDEEGCAGGGVGADEGGEGGALVEAVEWAGGGDVEVGDDEELPLAESSRPGRRS